MKRSDINSKNIQSIIDGDKKSQQKIKMNASLDYYNVKNKEITKRQKMMEILEEVEKIDQYGDKYFEEEGQIVPDLSKANYKLTHAYHYELVNQCKRYLCGNPVKYDFKSEVSEQTTDAIDNILYKDNDWTVFNQENVKNAQIFGKSWFRVIVDKNKKFRMLIIDPREIISYYDDLKDLSLLIRYFDKYEPNEKGEQVKVSYAEVYDNEKKDVYKKIKKWEKIESDVSLLSVQTKFGEDATQITEYGWNSIPFVEWKLGSDDMNMLDPIKSFIDICDLDLSDLANNVDDVQDAIWILQNYQGQSLREFMHDLKIRKSIKVGEGGGVEAKTIEIPTEARMRLYETAEKNIYRFGFGINFADRANLGNSTGVALKWAYGPLDEKSDDIENYGHPALNKLFNLMGNYLQLTYGVVIDSNDVEFTFDRTMITNEQEQVSMAISSSTVLSKETVLEHHPFVVDVDEELDRLSEDDEYAKAKQEEFFGQENPQDIGQEEPNGQPKAGEFPNI